MGAAARASMMVSHPFACYIYLYLILCLIENFYVSSQAMLYSLKSLNINATKIANYDRLKADFDEVVGEKTRLEGQLHQAIQDRDRFKSEWNLSKGEKAKLKERIIELLSITELEVEVARLKDQLEVEP